MGSTMLSGASSFDAVLFVAAANAKCPSEQAAAHLAALEAMDFSPGRVAIVQSKADILLTSGGVHAVEGRLESHAREAQSALRNSVAAAAPVFPVATLQGLGLDSLAMWLAAVPERSEATR